MTTNVDLKHEPHTFGNVLLCAVIGKQEIPKIPARVRYRNFVYMLTRNEEIIYVGRSTNLRLRLSGWKNCRDFDKVYLCEYLTHTENCQAERFYINHFKPAYNRR